MMSGICSVIMQDGGNGWDGERTHLAMGCEMWELSCGCQYTFFLIWCMFKIHRNDNKKINHLGNL